MVRTTLRMTVVPGREPDFITAWGEVARWASRAPGNLRQALARERDGVFVISSDWASREAFIAFERSPEQERRTASLRALRTGAEMTVAELITHIDGGPAACPQE